MMMNSLVQGEPLKKGSPVGTLFYSLIGSELWPSIGCGHIAFIGQDVSKVGSLAEVVCRAWVFRVCGWGLFCS